MVGSEERRDGARKPKRTARPWRVAQDMGSDVALYVRSLLLPQHIVLEHTSTCRVFYGSVWLYVGYRPDDNIYMGHGVQGGWSRPIIRCGNMLVSLVIGYPTSSLRGKHARDVCMLASVGSADLRRIYLPYVACMDAFIKDICLSGFLLLQRNDRIQGVGPPI